MNFLLQKGFNIADGFFICNGMPQKNQRFFLSFASRSLLHFFAARSKIYFVQQKQGGLQIWPKVQLLRRTCDPAPGSPGRGPGGTAWTSTASGMSILEISHRGKEYEAVHQEAMAKIRSLLGCAGQLQRAVPAGRRQPAVRHDAHEPARLGQDGRLRQLRRLGEEGDQGSQDWSEPSTSWPVAADKEFPTRVPAPTEIRLTGAAYVHLTSNETIGGIQCEELARTRQRCRLVSTCRRTSSRRRSTSTTSA